MYMLFAGYWYYPEGGWRDYIGTYASLEEAKNQLINKEELRVIGDWWHIVFEGKVIESGECKQGKVIVY